MLSTSDTRAGRRAGFGRRRADLRAATAEPHARLDLIVERLDLTSPDGYRRFVAASAAVLPAVERALEASGVADVLPDWDRRVRRTALAEDATTLGLTFGELAVPGFERSSLVGAAYVLEGSRLGARVLLPRALQNCDPLCCASTRYLAHGAGEGLWPSFLHVLEADPVFDLAGAETAALQVFAAFAAAFEAVEP